MRNCTGVPQCSAIICKSRWYFSSVKFALNCWRREGIMVAPALTGCGAGASPALGLDQKFPVFHNLLIIHPNVEFPPDYINVRRRDRKSTRLNSSHVKISYAVFCLKKKTKEPHSWTSW